MSTFQHKSECLRSEGDWICSAECSREQRIYNEAIEEAAKLVESRGGMPYYGRGRPGTPPAYSQAVATADAVRALKR